MVNFASALRFSGQTPMPGITALDSARRRPGSSGRTTMSDRALGTSLLVAGIAIAAMNLDDFGLLIGGLAIGAGLIFRSVAASSCRSLARCTAVKR
jgi:hypothetical protein